MGDEVLNVDRILFGADRASIAEAPRQGSGSGTDYFVFFAMKKGEDVKRPVQPH
jgi:hypothetical protein